VVMPKKGRLSAVDRARETDPEFVRLRRQHSAVESAIPSMRWSRMAWTCPGITESSAMPTPGVRASICLRRIRSEGRAGHRGGRGSSAVAPLHGTTAGRATRPAPCRRPAGFRRPRTRRERPRLVAKAIDHVQRITDRCHPDRAHTPRGCVTARCRMRGCSKRRRPPARPAVRSHGRSGPPAVDRESRSEKRCPGHD